MEIPLNLDKEKSDLFQGYLYAAIRKQTGNPFGPSSSSAGFRKDGCYEITMAIELPTDSERISLQLTLAIKPDGSLDNIQILPAEGMTDLPWSSVASTFIAGVLASALGNNLNRYFHRATFCRIGGDLDGEYWLPRFRFAPAIPENDKSYLMNAERYLYIDQEIDAIDQSHASDVGFERALQYSARLSLILDTGLYLPQQGMRWFIETNNGNAGVSSRLEHLGFSDGPWPVEMPAKETACRLGRYETSIFNERQNSHGLLMCPKETRTIFRGLNNCSPAVREAFDSCARLYQISLNAGRGFPTIRLAYQVGAVESITQKVLGYTGFSDFIRKEYPLQDGNTDTFLDHLYGSIRSAHLHGGAFPLGEFNSRNFSGGHQKEKHQSWNIDMFASRLIRQSIMNWVSKEIIPMGKN